jgi:hypothetical protein
MYYNGEGELVQGLPYKCIELSQWNPLLLLMYDKSKTKKEKK